MRAGELRHRLTIVPRATSNDDYGDPVETWTIASGTTVWGSVEQPSGREYFRAGQTQSDRTVIVRIRGGVAVTTTHRIWHAAQSRWYQVETILDTRAQGYEVELLCREVT